MASRCPRIQISPSPDLSVVLQELAKLTKQPQSRVVVELLEEGLPALQMTVKALRMVSKRPQEVEAMLSQFASKAIRDLSQEQINFSEAMKAKPGRKPKQGAGGRKP
jgi:hypothetical protein